MLRTPRRVTPTLQTPKTLFEAVRASLAHAARYNPGDVVAPAAVLWTDADGQWQPVVEQLRDLMPELLTLGDFDATTFVKNKVAMSRWEPKEHHEWWRHVSRIVGVPYEPQAHGLSVTPNILHGELAAQALKHLRFGPVDEMTSLCYWLARKFGTVPWTEYSLYTSVAELKGNLFDYHAHWDPCYYADDQLFSEDSCVWGADDFERLVQLPNGSKPGGKFIIVQSLARIPIERVRDYCLSFAG